MSNNVPHAVQSCHELLFWLIPQLDKFPRVRRFTLGERLESGLLAVMEELVDAAYSKQKQVALTQANRKLEISRHLWRLCHERKCRKAALTKFYATWFHHISPVQGKLL